MHGGPRQPSPSALSCGYFHYFFWASLLLFERPKSWSDNFFLIKENCNTLIQLITSTSSHHTNLSISPKVTINDENSNGKLTCKSKPLVQFNPLATRCQQRAFGDDVTYTAVRLLCVFSRSCVGRLTLWQIWLSSRRSPTAISHACSSLSSTLWSLLPTSASLPGKAPQPAPLHVCLSSVHRIRFSGGPWEGMCTELRWTDHLGAGSNPV